MTKHTGSKNSDKNNRNNTLVAESDLAMAIEAINERLSLALKSHQDENQCQILRECASSLRSNINRLVQPLTDEAFHTFVSSSYNDKAPGASVFEKVYEENEIVDEEALKKVQELRRTAREHASQIHSLRQSVLQDAVELAEQQVNQLVSNSSQEAQRVVKLDTNSGEAVEKATSRLEEMTTTMMQLQTALEKASKELPQELSSLSETVQAVEEKMASEQQPLPKTEAAIRSRGEQLVLDVQTCSSPEARLVSFLNQ